MGHCGSSQRGKQRVKERGRSRCYAEWRGHTCFIWVGGLAFVQLHLVDRWLGFDGETYEWAQYLLLGTLFPAMLLAVALASSFGPRISAGARLLQVLLALASVALAARALAPDVAPAVLAIALVQCLAAGALAATRVRRVTGSGLLVIRWS
jgi:hypothetical protein